MFPIPKDAKIEKFEMEVNGKMTEAELLDAKKAKQIYEKIVRESRDPALMEYSDHGMFKIRNRRIVFTLCPILFSSGEEKTAFVF